MGRREYEAGGERAIPLREEELEVRRHSEQTGEIIVTKYVVEERRRMNVPYTEEHVHVERRPASHPEARGSIGEGETVSIPIYEEEIEVTKRPVVREELVIEKERVQKEKPIEQTIRKEVPRVRKEGHVIEEEASHEMGEEHPESLSEEERHRRGLRP